MDFGGRWEILPDNLGFYETKTLELGTMFAKLRRTKTFSVYNSIIGLCVNEAFHGEGAHSGSFFDSGRRQHIR